MSRRRAIALVAIAGAAAVAAMPFAVRQPGQYVSRARAEREARHALAVFGRDPNSHIARESPAHTMENIPCWGFTFDGPTRKQEYSITVDAVTGKLMTFEDLGLREREVKGRLRRSGRGAMTVAEATAEGARIMRELDTPRCHLVHVTTVGGASGRSDANRASAIALTYDADMPGGYPQIPFEHAGPTVSGGPSFDATERLVSEYRAFWRYTVTPVSVRITPGQAGNIGQRVHAAWRADVPVHHWPVPPFLRRRTSSARKAPWWRSGVFLEYRGDEPRYNLENGRVVALPERVRGPNEPWVDYPFHMRLVYVVVREYREVWVDPASGNVLGMRDLQPK